MQSSQSVTGEGMLLHGYEVQALRTRRVSAPGLPRREEIHAEAEACLHHGENAGVCPPRGQIITVENGVPEASKTTAAVWILMESPAESQQPGTSPQGLEICAQRRRVALASKDWT